VLDFPPITFFGMIITADLVHGAGFLLAKVHFIEQRVIKLLFPAVSAGAIGLQWAPLVVVADESAALPVLAEFARVVVE